MGQVSIEVEAAAEAVWGVLSDPLLYGEWVVGTKNVVRADPEWPRVGAALEYELGVGPITVGDRTVVTDSRPSRLLVLRAQFKRLGAAVIRLELVPGATTTQVLMDEAPVDGVVEKLHTSLSDAALDERNRLALGRLKRLAEARG